MTKTLLGGVVVKVENDDRAPLVGRRRDQRHVTNVEVGEPIDRESLSGFDVRTLRADEGGGVCSARASGVRHNEVQVCSNYSTLVEDLKDGLRETERPISVVASSNQMATLVPSLLM